MAPSPSWVGVIFYVVLILVLLCFLVLVARLLFTLRAALDDERKINSSTGGTTVAFPALTGSRAPLVRRHCDNEFVYSLLDAECDVLCHPPGVYRSQRGVCVNVLAFGQTAVDNECDPNRGLLAYLIGDAQFGTTKLLCLSIDLGVQPDTVLRENTFCQGGSIAIDYVREFPQLRNCTCPSGELLAVIPGTSQVRSRGFCINASSARLYYESRALFDTTIQLAEVAPRKNRAALVEGYPTNLVPGPDAPSKYRASYHAWMKRVGRHLFQDDSTPIFADDAD